VKSPPFKESFGEVSQCTSGITGDTRCCGLRKRSISSRKTRLDTVDVLLQRRPLDDVLVSVHDFAARSRESASMTTLYDLFGVRPDVDDEALKAAFREAAKANHPDLHPGDPDASMRFGRIGGAYAILRDAEKRAAYDQLLKLEREQLDLQRKQFGSRSRRIISYTMNTFVFPAIAVAGLAVVLAGGYTLRTDMAGPDETRDQLWGVQVPNLPTLQSREASTAKDGGLAPGNANGAPALSSAGSDTKVAEIIKIIGGPIDQAGANTATGNLKNNDGIDPLDQDEALPVGVPTPSLKQDTIVPKLFSSDAKISDENHDVEIPDIKTPERSRRVARRQAISRTPFKQASLAYDCILSAGLVCAFPSSPSSSQRKRR
jgi:curved DNA-binding protein CbpA